MAGAVAFAASISAGTWAFDRGFAGAVGVSVGSAGAGAGDSGAFEGGRAGLAMATSLGEAAGAFGGLSVATGGLPREAALSTCTGRRYASLPPA